MEESKNFINDLKADSLALVELGMAFEDNFGISIPDEDYEKLKTVGDAINYVKKPVRAELPRGAAAAAGLDSPPQSSPIPLAVPERVEFQLRKGFRSAAAAKKQDVSPRRPSSPNDGLICHA